MFVVAFAPTDTQGKVLLLYVNTGSVICARRGMIVNTFMSMTCPKCQNVISSVNLVSKTIQPIV